MSEEEANNTDDAELQTAGDAALASHPLTAPRLEKVAAMRRHGTDPYPVRFEPDARAAELAGEFENLEPGTGTDRRVSMAGRIVGKRDLGKLIFAVLQDGTGRMQLFVDAAVLGDRQAEFGALDLGDWIGVTGEVITTRRGELSVKVEEFLLLAKSLRPLPEKWHGLVDTEVRFRRRYLDLTVNDEARRVMRSRSTLVQSLRESFSQRGFLEVETPMLQVQPGGALAKPFVTHHNSLGIDMYLRIAPELYLKRLVVGGVERVFEVNRNFRNEGISPRHNPEFTMLEAYQAYADYGDFMDLLESVVAEAATAVTGATAVSYQGRPLDLGAPWRRLDYVGSVEDVTGTGFDISMDRSEARRRATALDVELQDHWGTGSIIAAVFEDHVEPGLWDPTIAMDYPLEISPLAREHRSKPGVTERFEVIAAGWEIANAFSELNDPLEQRRRFEAQAAAREHGDDEAHPIDEDYLRALEYGMPPAAGLGLGVDRLAMILTDQASIREVILFPHLRPE